MAFKIEQASPVRERTRTTVFRVSAILVAFAALGLATGWHFYGNLIEPHPTIVADPTKNRSRRRSFRQRRNHR